MDERERTAAWREGERARFMRSDAHRFIRPDAYRFMAPGAPRWQGKEAVRYFWPDNGRERVTETGKGVAERELLAARASLHRLRGELAALKAELKFRRRLRALKANFNPDQPRVPAGNPDGGQWTIGGDATGDNDSHIRSDTTPDNLWELGAQYAQNDSPEIPRQRPSTIRERHRIAREIARLVGPIGKVLQAAEWLLELYPSIQAYRDPPKTLEELQQAVTDQAVPGYQDHHIVGQAARKENERGFPVGWIDTPENIVRIPTFKHWEINGWYETRNENFGGLSPREYLRGKDWSERYRVGLEALIEHKVLKP